MEAGRDNLVSGFQEIAFNAGPEEGFTFSGSSAPL
jgi:hypothetical protein